MITKRIILFCLFSYFTIPIFPKSAVTYTFSGGRFGDCLVSYCHALWIAYIFDLDLIYKPFKYSDQLMMHAMDLEANCASRYKQVLHITHAFVNGIQDNTLYVVPFFPESHIEHHDPRCPFLFQVDWKNEGFVQELKKRIFPKNELLLPKLSHDVINIAVHVRKGTGWDIPQFAPTFEKLTEMHPLKWPPSSYYIEQIKKIMELYPGQKLCFYIFSDHDNPAEIIKEYKTCICDSRITWKCRDESNRHDLNVLEDFFALTCFDCLIRNDSNFSIIASKLGNYKTMIAPWGSKKCDNVIIIDEILIELNI